MSMLVNIGIGIWGMGMWTWIKRAILNVDKIGNGVGSHHQFAETIIEKYIAKPLLWYRANVGIIIILLHYFKYK